MASVYAASKIVPQIKGKGIIFGDLTKPLFSIRHRDNSNNVATFVTYVWREYSEMFLQFSESVIKEGWTIIIVQYVTVTLVTSLQLQTTYEYLNGFPWCL